MERVAQGLDFQHGNWIGIVSFIRMHTREKENHVLPSDAMADRKRMQIYDYPKP
jgi:hypothetical protein